MTGRHMLRPAAVAFCAALGLAAPSAAWAHAFLKQASPAVGSTVAAPAMLRLTYTERVEPLFCSITLRNAAGSEIPLSRPQAAEDGLQLVVTLPALPPSTYTVHWHATSVDTHKTQGSFRFTVRSNR